MKNYDEMYQSVLSKYEEYQEKKKKRIHAIRRTVPVFACLCFIAILGLGRWNQYSKFPEDSIQPDVIETVTKETQNNQFSSTTYITSNAHSKNGAEIVTNVVNTSSTKTNKVSTTRKQQVTISSTVVTETMSNRENIKVTAKQTEKNTDSNSITIYTITTSTAATVSITQSSQPVTNKQVNTKPITTSNSIITQTSRITTIKQVNTVPITSTTSKLLDTSKNEPTIRIYSSFSDHQYIELIVDEEVILNTKYNSKMSNWLGIGVLLEFNSTDYPIILSTNEGYFTVLDKGKDSITKVGNTYNFGNEGFIFWTSDNLSYSKDFKCEIIIYESKSGVRDELGKLCITSNDGNSLSVIWKDVDNPM